MDDHEKIRLLLKKVENHSFDKFSNRLDAYAYMSGVFYAMVLNSTNKKDTIKSLESYLDFVGENKN